MMLALKRSAGCAVSPGQQRRAFGSRRPARATCTKPAALFGWGSGGDKSEREAAKEEEFRLQQELLAKRRSGVLIKEANDRRKKVQETLATRRELRQAEKDALGRGEMPDSLNDWKPYDDETNKNANSGIVVPLLPFGIKKYDDGERFDLRSPYSDGGWVDPEEVDAWAGLKKIGTKILNFTGKSEREPLKPIMWATPYAKKRGEEERRQQQAKEEKSPKDKK